MLRKLQTIICLIIPYLYSTCAVRTDTCMQTIKHRCNCGHFISNPYGTYTLTKSCLQDIHVYISVQSTLLSYCSRNVLEVVSTPHSQVEYEEKLQAHEVEHDVMTEVTVPQVKTLFRYQGQGMGFEKGE